MFCIILIMKKSEKYVRIVTTNGEMFGRESENVVELLSASPWDEKSEVCGKINKTDAKLIAPCKPGKVVCLGINYKAHSDEFGHMLPEDPLIFMKAPSSVIGPDENIVYPPYWTKRVDYEAELAIVIGKQAKRVKKEEADDYIFGYTCLNDVTARDLQRKDGQWIRAKSFDTFCPIGPAIVTNLDHSSLKIRSFVNGELRQNSNTSFMIFDVPAIIEFVSHVMTLEPGDIIATGTPEGIGSLTPGDIVEVEVEGIGRLKNSVV